MSPISEPEGIGEALIQSYAMIIFSEIGDKTFLIAAILAMRHPRAAVFAGAISSLIVMSILSAVMGHILPTLLPKKWTQFAAAFLFLVFGTKMMVEAKRMQGENKMQEEMKEAEEEIEDDDAGHEGSNESGESFQLEDLEEAKGTLEQTASRPAPPSSRTSRSADSFSKGLRNFFSLFLGPVFVQAFVLTFLGEWGDRSQIATIALGAAHNVYLVTLGTVVGHSCCTALAVIGGRYASTKISAKHVTYGGAVLFLIFSVIYLYEAIRMPNDLEMSIPISPTDQPAVP